MIGYTVNKYKGIIKLIDLELPSIPKSKSDVEIRLYLLLPPENYYKSFEILLKKAEKLKQIRHDLMRVTNIEKDFYAHTGLQCFYRLKGDEENILRTGVVDSSDKLNIVIRWSYRFWVIPKSEIEYFYYSVLKREL